MHIYHAPASERRSGACVIIARAQRHYSPCRHLVFKLRRTLHRIKRSHWDKSSAYPLTLNPQYAEDGNNSTEERL